MQVVHHDADGCAVIDLLLKEELDRDIEQVGGIERVAGLSQEVLGLVQGKIQYDGEGKDLFSFSCLMPCGMIV